MQARLFINNFIEVEGSEEFVAQVYNDLKEKINGMKSSVNAREAMNREVAETANDSSATNDAKRKPKRSASASTTVFKLVDELWQEKAVQFKQRYDQYEDVKSAPKYITLFLYILKNDLQMSNVTVDHLYTCFKLVGAKQPKFLKIAVSDAKKKAWVIDDWEDLKIAPLGENAVMHEFSKKQS